MTERTPIFGRKRNNAQIGYVEGDEAFDLGGRKICSYNRATGNLRDSPSGGILGHVSLEGKFVGESSIADELFGQPDGQAHTEFCSIAGMAGLSLEKGEPVAAGEGTDISCSATALADTTSEPPSASSVGSGAFDRLDQLDRERVLNAPAATEPASAESILSDDELLERAIRMVRDGLAA